ncbi:hypothetical protein DFS33DRAFT_1279979 [Desarmillaria ectypa]|nr:hypothetical protein DFS33DRAFT_1279979 [Desarmillaria ectypa]
MFVPQDAETSNLSSASTQRKRKLPAAGTDILREFFDDVSHNPNNAQQQALLAKIHSIDPTFERKHLSDWFKRRRTSDRSRGKLLKEFPNSVLTRTWFLPSADRAPLNPEQIKHLTTLFNANKNPAWDVLETWASLLGVKTTVVTDWIAEKNKPPSPAHTVSPEPLYRRSTSVSTTLSVVPSPVIPHAGFTPFKPEPPQSPVRPTPSPILPPALPPSSSPKSLIITIPKRIPEEDTYKRDWLNTFAGYDAATSGPTGPITRERLNELFEPHEKNMKAFLEKVKNGELRHQGYTSVMAKP